MRLENKIKGRIYGYENIPHRWLTNLRNFDKIEEITERLKRY